MKKKLLSILLLIFTLQLFSQTEQERQKLKKQNNSSELLKIAEKYKSKYTKSDLLAIATKNNWEYRIDRDGTYSELVGVSRDNRPIYHQTYNEGAGITSRANTLYTGGSLGLDVHGENMISGIWDAGQALPTHELFSGRMTVMDGATSSHYHATHVAGTVIGTDQVQNGLARGMAFMASGHSYDWNNDVSEVSTAASNGLLLSNHSYGPNPAFVSINQWGKYEDDAQAFDDIMFNAPYFQFVCAAGNSRGRGYNTSKNGYDLLLGHAMAKNGITVAAVSEVINYTGPGSVLMSSFSSWGSTDDGRIKPDISAKGVNTFSAFDNSNTSYDTISGTSMASPSVNGTLLLLQQYHNELYNEYMRAATLRALMIHTADEAGTDPGPDYRFGWGLINAEASAVIIRDKDFFAIMDENTLQQNETYSINYTALGTEPIKVTICWTDPVGTLPSSTIDDATPVLVNDLDVRVFKNGTEIFPWKLDINNPTAAATTGDNIVDNVEKIQIDNPTGSYEFVVTHKGNLVNNQQAYSLIITGVSKNDFWFESQNSDNLEVCNTDDTLTADFDFFRSITANDDVQLSLLGAPAGLNATFSPVTVTSENTFSLQLSGISTVATGSYDLTVRGVSTEATYDYPVTLNIYDGLTENVTLTSPTDTQDSLEIPLVFTWQAITNASSYQIQIATEAAFTNIIEDTTVATSEYEAQNLAEGSQYFWRVKPINSCGDGNFSTVYSFSTACASNTDLIIQSAASSSITLEIINSNASGWEIEYVPQGDTPTGTGTIVNTMNPSFTGLSSDTCYDFYVRSQCDVGLSNWRGPYEFCTSPDYCSGDHFYDSGGVSGNYQNGENWTETIYPENTGDRIRAVFNSFQLENCCDFLSIYNGPDATYPLLFNGNGGNSPGTVVSTDISGALTFVFTSDSSVTGSGWNASIICETQPACSNIPTDLQLLSAAETTLTVGWTETGTSTSWELEIVPTGTAPTGTGIVTTNNPYTFTGLTSNTLYDVYLRSLCTGGSSDWINVNSLSTTCAAIAAPFLETFSSNTTPNCWVESGSESWLFNTNAAYAAANAGDHTPGGGTNYAWIDGSSPNGPNQISTLTTSLIDISSLTNPALEFSVFSYNSSGNFYNTLSVEINDGAQWVELLNLQGATANNGWQTFTYDLSTYSLPNEIQVRYTITENSPSNPYDNDILIDDISIDELPACPNTQLDLQLLSATSSTLTVGWTETGSATSWELEIVPTGTAPTGTGTVTTDNPYTFTGLDPITAYDVYLRGICTDGTSDWINASGFSTTCTAIIAPFLETFPSNTTPNCWIESGSEGWNFNTNAAYAASNAGDHTPSGGTNYAWIDGSSPNGLNQISTLTTNTIDITNLTTPALEFSVFSYNSSGNFYNTLSVEVNDGTQWIELLNLQGATANNGWETFIYDLSTYNLPNEIQVRYTITENSSSQPYNNDILIDDISIDELPACSNSPSNLQLQAVTASSLTIGWTETGTSTSWEVEIVPTGTSPTGMGTITVDNPYTFTGLDSGTAYDVYIKAICTDGNSSATAGTFETPFNYCSGDRFYDSGGATGNYQNGENWTETIFPENDGDIIRATFHSFQLENCCDYLSIYNGPDATYPLLFTGNGSNSPGTVESTDPSGALTFVFTSDSSVTGSGWDAEIMCVTLGIEEETLRENVVYYPNPVASELYVSARKMIKNVQVYDFLGRLVVTQKVNNLSGTIDFQNYREAVYIMKLNFEDGTYLDNIKVIKK
ncbi:S8 family serine peptidase [Kordia sp.]|uniref:S8 family serine peptidase n=1 Tax=Kordia sp. TaxID=1965332 RepID=UPI003B5AC179